MKPDELYYVAKLLIRMALKTSNQEDQDDLDLAAYYLFKIAEDLENE